MEGSISDLTRRAQSVMPLEEKLETGRQRSNLIIGVPREISPQESRINLVPEGVNLLTRNGHEVIIEAGAGEAGHFTDLDYSQAGAQIVHSPREVFRADIILKVAPLTAGEMEHLRPRQLIFSSLQLTLQKEEYFRALMAKRVTAIAHELIRDGAGILSVIRAMSEIAGCASIFIAAEYLACPEKGKGKMFGGLTGIPPTELVIIGAGTVGEFAARSAIGLGAQVKVFDNSVYRLRRLQNNIGVRIYTAILEPRSLREALANADVLIGAIHAVAGKSPCIITEEMIGGMKEGAILIDVSIDQGGCFETSRPTTHSDPVFTHNGITHYCVPNIPARFPQTASQALNNIFVPILLDAGNEGGVEKLITRDAGLRHGVYLFNGTVTNPAVSKNFNLPFQDINLLMAAFQ